jgi:hypothetical protein
VKDSQASLGGEWAGGTHENPYPAGADDRKSSGPIPMKEKNGGWQEVNPLTSSMHEFYNSIKNPRLISDG